MEQPPKEEESPTAGFESGSDALETHLARVLSALERGDHSALDRACHEHPEWEVSLRNRMRLLKNFGMTEDMTFPARVGHFLLTERISSGGMGEVYLGRQEEPIRRTIAMKMIRAGRRTERYLELFAREQQILADLTHPGITKIFESGRTEDGQPYFAMEFVPGEHISTHCKRLRLSLTDRLRLFVSVCDPIHHAHMNGVLHRDLKPSNILVTTLEGKTLVKVIDFGLGKILESTPSGSDESSDLGASPREDSSPPDSLTHPGMGTRFYCSPEQQLGWRGRVDLRTDVYSLGAVLYELLCGCHPQESTSSNRRPGPQSEGLPSCQSEEKLESAARNCGLRSATALRRRLRGDLDAIVGKAMATDRNERYGSVQAMADDVERHLRGEPVVARDSGWPLRTARFLQRNAAVASLAGLILVGLIVGIATLAAERRDLRESRDQLQSSLDRYELLEGVTEFQTLLREELAFCRSTHMEDREVLSHWIQRAVVYRDQPRKLSRAIAGLSNLEADRRPDVLLRRLNVHVKTIQATLEPGGALALAIHRFEHGLRIYAASVVEAATLWEQASKEVQAAEAYGDLNLIPQEGLIPLGKDPDSQLQEFAVIIPGLTIPSRGADGRLNLNGAWAPILVLIPEADHWIGSQKDRPQEECYDPEVEQESEGGELVTLPPFFMGKFEVTEAQYLAMSTVATPTDLSSVSADLPRVNVSWLEADRAARCYGLDLPLEVEWEAAARGGTASIWWTGDEVESLEGAVNAADQSFGDHRERKEGLAPFRDGFAETAPVTTMRGNAYGLHHMLGNVSEVCCDEYVSVRENEFTTLPPETTSEGVPLVDRPWRGGSFLSTPKEMKSASRRSITVMQRSSYVGFRLARLYDNES